MLPLTCTAGSVSGTKLWLRCPHLHGHAAFLYLCSALACIVNRPCKSAVERRRASADNPDHRIVIVEQAPGWVGPQQYQVEVWVQSVADQASCACGYVCCRPIHATRIVGLMAERPNVHRRLLGVAIPFPSASVHKRLLRVVINADPDCVRARHGGTNAC